jgi:hypothetical protein
MCETREAMTSSMTKSRSNMPAILEKRRLSIMPARAFMDSELDIMSLRLLGCLCLHANKHGICWPTRETIANYIDVHPDSLSRRVTALTKRGYIRKLNPRKFKVPRRGSKWPVNRYQVLYDGTETALPSLEEFFAPKPKAIEDMDGAPTDRADQIEQQGVQGERSRISVSLASAFCRAVERASGENRSAERQIDEAERLARLEIQPEAVAEATERAVLEALRARRSTPQTLRQVSEAEGW